MALNKRKLTRRIFIGIGAFFLVCIFTGLGAVVWFLRRECKRNHSVKNNPVPDDHFGKVVSTRSDPPDIYNLDIVTVDSDGATITWATANSCLFQIAEETDASATWWTESAHAKYHMAKLTGLQPDTDYSFRLWEPAGNIEKNLRFRTLSGAGDGLFRFGTLSDNHFKPDSFSWPDGRYFRRCADIHHCLIKDLNGSGADFLINKGDLTDVYAPYRLRAYGKAMQGLTVPVHCIPGNHDHLRNKDFNADWVDFAGTPQVYRSFDHKGIHFVLLDTCWTGEQERGYIGPKQLSWLTEDLEQNASKLSFIFTHHPVNGDVEENRVVHDYRDFQDTISKFPGVAAVFSAHVHRNYVTVSDVTPGIPYVETAAVIQYPMGYNLYEVSTTGIKQVFRKLSDISLSEESWLVSPIRCVTNPGDALGKMSDRNFFLPFRAPISMET